MTATAAGPIPAEPTAEARPVPATDAILREITVGGLAGLIVGVLVAGIGGRLAMRLAALLVPEATGAFTENGNEIGRITADGTLALIVFVGLFFGVVIGAVWVTVRPWLPVALPARIAATTVLVTAIGTPGLVERRNPDFVQLDHDPLVVAVLIGLVALAGPVLVLMDRWLDRHLPGAPGTPRGPVAAYALVTSIGVVLTVLLVLPAFLGARTLWIGLALIVVGVCTLWSWRARATGRSGVSPLVGAVARLALVATGVAALVLTTGEVSGALGLD